MKLLIPIALILGGAFYWISQHPEAVLDDEDASEAQSLEPEFATEVKVQSNQNTLRVPTEETEPEDGPEVSDQAPANNVSTPNPAKTTGPANPPARTGPNPRSGGQPQTRPPGQDAPQPNSGPREEIVGGTKNIYGEDGISLIATGGWENGKRQGYWQRFDDQGRTVATENYSDGVLDGLSESWYPDGKKRSSVPMVEGQIHGHAQYWLPTGEIDTAKTGTYEKGERVSD